MNPAPRTKTDLRRGRTPVAKKPDAETAQEEQAMLLDPAEPSPTPAPKPPA